MLGPPCFLECPVPGWQHCVSQGLGRVSWLGPDPQQGSGSLVPYCGGQVPIEDLALYPGLEQGGRCPQNARELGKVWAEGGAFREGMRWPWPVTSEGKDHWESGRFLVDTEAEWLVSSCAMQVLLGHG